MAQQYQSRHKELWRLGKLLLPLQLQVRTPQGSFSLFPSSCRGRGEPSVRTIPTTMHEGKRSCWGKKEKGCAKGPRAWEDEH